MNDGRRKICGRKQNLPDVYESLDMLWNPKVASRSTVVMDKSPRVEKLNVELVSKHFWKRIVPSRTPFDKFSSRACQPVEKYFFARRDKCAVMHIASYLRFSAFQRTASGTFSKSV